MAIILRYPADLVGVPLLARLVIRTVSSFFTVLAAASAPESSSTSQRLSFRVREYVQFLGVPDLLLPIANQYIKFKTTYLLRYLELEGILRDLGLSARVLF